MQNFRRAGFTLLELLMVMLILSVMTTIAAGQYGGYLARVGPEQAARVVGTYVSLTRAYAIQRRAPVSLVVNTTDHSLMIRTTTDTMRTMDLGENTDFKITTMSMGFTGDSLSFSSRGVCRECGLTGTGTITVGGSASSYVVTFNALGVWKMARQ
jgi:prepilin-type N-terminal cleavage/methylation domain-containing protein